MKTISIGFNTMDVYEHQQIMYPGGNELNTSIYAKWLEGESGYLGYFGDDDRSKHLIYTLAYNGVDISRCKYLKGRSGIAITNLVDGERVFIRTNGGGVSAKNPICLEEEDLEYIQRFDLILTGYYASYEAGGLGKLKRIGVPVAYDFSEEFTSDDLKEVCPGICMGFMSCSGRPEEEIRSLLKDVVGYGAKIAVATRGEEGQLVYDGQKFYSHSIVQEKVIDTMGAGDSFMTAFAIAYLKNRKKGGIGNALEEASGFAAKVCGIKGAVGMGLPYEGEIADECGGCA